MIGNLWFALLAFVLGAGLTYLRMAGKATRRIAKPVPHRLVMGGIIPGVVDPPADPSPVDVGPQWTIRVGSPTSAQSEAPAPELGGAVPESEVVVAEAEVASVVEATVELAPAAQPLEPPVQPLEPPVADVQPLEPPVQPLDSPVPAAVQQLEPPAPLDAEILQPAPKPEPAPKFEPDSSAWWAAAFDKGDPGPYPGALRHGSDRAPIGSRILDVDDDFAAALGASAAASAASAALFGTFHHYAAEPEPVRPERGGRSPETAPTPPAVEPADPPAAADFAAESEEALIKGNGDSMLYHTPDSPWYGRTKAEQWFHTEQEAQAAGYQRWNSRLEDGGN